MRTHNPWTWGAKPFGGESLGNLNGSNLGTTGLVPLHACIIQVVEWTDRSAGLYAHQGHCALGAMAIPLPVRELLELDAYRRTIKASTTRMNSPCERLAPT